MTTPLPDDLAARVLDANDLVYVVGAYLSLRPVVGKVYRSMCPFREEHAETFVTDPKAQRWTCACCGKSGDAIDFVQFIEHVSRDEAVLLLARRAGIVA